MTLYSIYNVQNLNPLQEVNPFKGVKYRSFKLINNPVNLTIFKAIVRQKVPL